MSRERARSSHRPPPHRAHSPPPSSALPSNIAPWPCDERTHLTLNSMQRAPSVVRWAYNRGAAWCAAIVYRAVLPTALSLSRKSGRLETKFNGRTAEGSESFQLSGELTRNAPSPYSANVPWSQAYLIGIPTCRILPVVRLSNAAVGLSVHHAAPLPTLMSLIRFFWHRNADVSPQDNIMVNRLAVWGPILWIYHQLMLLIIRSSPTPLRVY